MSRLGKKPVVLPQGVSFTLEGKHAKVKGPKGELSFLLTDHVSIKQDDSELTVELLNETKEAKAMWGTTRAQLFNLVTGVSEGFTRSLELVGVGYRAAMKGSDIELSLGFSHPVVYTPRKGISLATPKPTEITISGPDKQVVGQTAAELRQYRAPEPYKGKGVRYAGEKVRRKEGKKK
jgi:large subunit ribosomal protein L6